LKSGLPSGSRGIADCPAAGKDATQNNVIPIAPATTELDKHLVISDSLRLEASGVKDLRSGTARHLHPRVAIAVTALSPIERAWSIIKLNRASRICRSTLLVIHDY
jgi:hypothetical protein